VVSGGGYTGAGLPPRYTVSALGVFKAYCSRVGGGPFPTELHDETGQRIREIGQEYGTTTGRPRRIGWFDAVVAHFSAQLNGLEGVALTRLDVLDDLPVIRICTAYRHNGAILKAVPPSVEVLAACEPIYEDFPGWQTATGEARTFADLPEKAQAYVHRLEELMGCGVDIVSVGPARDQTICRRDLFCR
jgi:adenylosuccinate synthase